jgi:hypothetical protein
MNRKIEITVSDGFEDSTFNLSRTEIDSAMGYLARWAIHSDSKKSVRIHCANDGSIRAVYMDLDGNVTYSMAAILKSDNTYGFHS